MSYQHRHLNHDDIIIGRFGKVLKKGDALQVLSFLERLTPYQQAICIETVPSEEARRSLEWFLPKRR